MQNLLFSSESLDVVIDKVSSEVIRKLQIWGFSPPEIEQSMDKMINRMEAAELLSVSLSTIDNYRRRGLLPFHRLGNSVRFKTSELLEAFQKIGK